MRFVSLVAVTAATALVASIGFSQTKGKGTVKPDSPPKAPLGLLPIPWPANNPIRLPKADLGRLLYFDKRLSADGTISCATCHDPAHGFTDSSPVSSGIKGQKGRRSAPTVVNRAYSEAQFWDGRAATLEAQAVGPIANPIEMGEVYPHVVKKLSAISGYRDRFQAAFGTPEITMDRVGQAIATFERTLLSGNSAYDRYKAGKKTAMNASQIRGMQVYFDKAKCDACHEGVNFTANSYNNLGIGADKPNPDVGRYVVTMKDDDWGRFKTPTLRDIAKTAPYMHDGRFKTLEEVVDYYDKGGIPNKNLDQRLVKLNLSDQDKKDLVAFLTALDGEPIRLTIPTDFRSNFLLRSTRPRLARGL